LSYQWQFNAAPLSDETNATLALANVQLSQAGDYWVIVANELGSATSSVATLTVVMPPTLIRVVSTSAASGGPVDLPVQIVARGQENALGFSLQFDPTRLSFVDVALSSSAPGEATLITNPNQANNGRVGVLVALPTGAAFPSGTQ